MSEKIASVFSHTISESNMIFAKDFSERLRSTSFISSSHLIPISLLVRIIAQTSNYDDCVFFSPFN